MEWEEGKREGEEGESEIRREEIVGESPWVWGEKVGEAVDAGSGKSEEEG